MRIIGPPSAALSLVTERINAMGASVHPRFLTEMVEPLWSAGLLYAIDPVGLVAQSAKETGWGNFRGAVPALFMNTCGLKVREPAYVKSVIGTTNDDHTLLHAQFPSWRIGAIAHAQHVRAYAGWPVADGDDVYSPRYHLVVGKSRLENWSEFGSGRWAPAADYGVRVEEIMARLR